MFTIKKIFIGIFTFFTILILVYSSYFYTRLEKNFTIPQLENTQAGEHFYTVSDDNIKEDPDGNIKLLQMNQFDSVISTSRDVAVNNSIIQIPENSTNIVHIQSLDTTYTTQGTNYNFSLQHPGDILISNADEKTTIFNLNTKIDIQIVDDTDNSFVNTVILYPHQYYQIVHSQKFISGIKNTDVSKVQQNSPIRYHDTAIFSNKKVHPDFISKIIRISDEQR